MDSLHIFMESIHELDLTSKQVNYITNLLESSVYRNTITATDGNIDNLIRNAIELIKDGKYPHNLLIEIAVFVKANSLRFPPVYSNKFKTMGTELEQLCVDVNLNDIPDISSSVLTLLNDMHGIGMLLTSLK